MAIHHIVTLAAFLVMLYALWSVISLKKKTPGGMVGKNLSILTILVAFFALGYLAMPFMSGLTLEILELVVAVVFLFGAVYVVVTINLIHNVIKVMSD